MSQVKILFKKNGENIYTEADPFKPYNEQTDAPLLQVMDKFCLSFDDNQLVTGNKYELHEVDIPDWLSPEEYCRDPYKWKFILVHKELTDKLQDKTFRVYRMEFEQIKALAQLFKVKEFRSSFRKSIYDQVMAWMNDPEPKYRSPLSPAQWNAISRYIR